MCAKHAICKRVPEKIEALLLADEKCQRVNAMHYGRQDTRKPLTLKQKAMKYAFILADNDLQKQAEFLDDYAANRSEAQKLHSKRL